MHLLAETADFLAELSGDAKELFQWEAVERTIGQFVFHVFLRPEQARQFLFMRGSEFFLGGFLQQGAKRFDLGGLLVAPFHERALGDVEFAGDVVETPALGSEFDEFVCFVWSVHMFVSLIVVLAQ